LDGVHTAAEQGRLATRDALTRLQVAQQEEFEAQVAFLPFDNEEIPLNPEDLSPDDLWHNVDQRRPPTRSQELITINTEAFRPSRDAVLSDADRLAESIRKVEEMRQQQETWQQKELERYARAAAKEKECKQADEQERLARKKEFRECLAREKIARERTAELEEQQRIKRWKKAKNKEVQRCRTRDRSFCANKSTSWPIWLALQRFQAVCEEFDSITHSEQQPLVFESIPWPVLHRPDSLKVSTIDGSSVEFFFREIRPRLQTVVYKDLVEKTQRRFHPDRWSSRGILATVFDGDIREQIREAGNVVSQAITPIWRESQNL
jgi:hypothetical protein